MAPDAADSSTSSPWLSVWLHPRRVVERILAGNFGWQVLLLAALGTISEFATWLIRPFGTSSASPDWRIIAVVIVAAAAAGIVGLYLTGCVLKWTGALLGGRASMATIRAALAWGGAPFAIGVPICLFGFFVLALSGLARGPSFTIALNLILAALTLWATVLALWMYGRVQGFGFWRTVASFAAGALVLPVIVALLIRIFLFQPFNIPAGSMMPTLLVGDYFFVSKYAYGYTHYSLPFSPRLFSGRLLASEPQRGDVVVFRLPKDDSVDFVKRIVGLPGDRIQMIDDVLQINGQPVKHERIDDFVTGDTGPLARMKRYRETLPNGVSYTVIAFANSGFYANTPVYTVPLGHYFVLGDNLDNSTDSRVLSQIGYVPFENLVGRAAMIFYSIDRGSSGAQHTIRLERIGTVVR
ncbi:MAG TPA: signal peptidase I [Xanthobacteraceae bacterium]|nr:signal peptidase I [Xanthobacteraceae bacterium]